MLLAWTTTEENQVSKSTINHQVRQQQTLNIITMRVRGATDGASMPTPRFKPRLASLSQTTTHLRQQQQLSMMEA